MDRSSTYIMLRWHRIEQRYNAERDTASPHRLRRLTNLLMAADRQATAVAMASVRQYNDYDPPPVGDASHD